MRDPVYPTAMTTFLKNGSSTPHATVVLAHGAGAPMDSPFMNAISEALAENGVSTWRFEFAYMAARRDGQRKPPPRAERLMQPYRDILGEVESDAPVFIGGKSMGGRVASMIAEEAYKDGQIAGLVCLGYPFHPPAKPDALRTAHLGSMTAPMLICQGTRDPFGTEDQVKGYTLSDAITLAWLEDGDHDLKPRKASGLSHEQNLEAAARAIAEWMRTRQSA